MIFRIALPASTRLGRWMAVRGDRPSTVGGGDFVRLKRGLPSYKRLLRRGERSLPSGDRSPVARRRLSREQKKPSPDAERRWPPEGERLVVVRERSLPPGERALPTPVVRNVAETRSRPRRLGVAASCLWDSKRQRPPSRRTYRRRQVPPRHRYPRSAAQRLRRGCLLLA